MTHIHNNKVKKIAECDLQHDIINPCKRTNNLNSHYSPILYGCMNTRKGREKFKNFRILLGSVTHKLVILIPILRLKWIST